MEEIRFRWHGTEYAGRIIGEGTEGRTIVEALQHGPRFAAGTRLALAPTEIVSRERDSKSDSKSDENRPVIDPKSEIHPTISERAVVDLDALQKAMDEERETLPTVQEILADPNPTPPLSASKAAAALPTPKPRTEKMSGDRLAEKMKRLADGVANHHTKIEARTDVALARMEALEGRQTQVFEMHETVLASSEAGLEAMEGALRQMSNGGPDGPLPAA